MHFCSNQGSVCSECIEVRSIPGSAFFNLPNTDVFSMTSSEFRQSTMISYSEPVSRSRRGFLTWCAMISCEQLLLADDYVSDASAPSSGTAPEAMSQSESQNAAQTAETEELAVASWQTVADLPKELAILPTVFWEPADTESLRQLIRNTPLVKDRSVLEIGTGSGLIALCCLQAGAANVVATDINPNAVRNAALNAERLGFQKRMQCRLVSRRSPDAWSVVASDETFDLIISNPPWEDRKPGNLAEFALYDPGFQLLRSLLAGCRKHLKSDGKMLLAYGCVSAIRTAIVLAKEHNLKLLILDDRQLDDLAEVFLPGMQLEVTVPQD
jgi:release factor glutamine methyltransferase